MAEKLRCQRCGRLGTRDFQMTVAYEQDGSVVSPLIVCAKQDACRRRRVKYNAPPLPQDPGPWGTFFLAARITPCPLCSAPIHPTMAAVMTSWTKRGTPVQRGTQGAVHLVCAVRNDIEVEYSAERIRQDINRILEIIPKDKRRKRAA